MLGGKSGEVGGKVTEDTERNRGRNNFLVEHRDKRSVTQHVSKPDTSCERDTLDMYV